EDNERVELNAPSGAGLQNRPLDQVLFRGTKEPTPMGDSVPGVIAHVVADGAPLIDANASAARIGVIQAVLRHQPRGKAAPVFPLSQIDATAAKRGDGNAEAP